MSQLTTHILDTTTGKPAQGVTIVLFQQDPVDPITAGWRQIALGTTDQDGRIPNLLPKEVVLEPGMYKMHFATKNISGNKVYKPFIPMWKLLL